MSDAFYESNGTFGGRKKLQGVLNSMRKKKDLTGLDAYNKWCGGIVSSSHWPIQGRLLGYIYSYQMSDSFFNFVDITA